jgi:hypothetical protein
MGSTRASRVPEPRPRGRADVRHRASFGRLDRIVAQWRASVRWTRAFTATREGACAPRSGLGGDGKPWRIGTEVYGDRDILPRDVISRKLSVPNAERVFFIRYAFRARMTVQDIFALRKIDPWFLTQIEEIVRFEEELAASAN